MHQTFRCEFSCSAEGSVGKTSLAAATGLRLSKLGYRTFVMSVDPAHSLGDSFAPGGDLFHRMTSDPLSVSDKLSVLKVNIQAEISTYIVSVLRTTGIGNAQAQELAIRTRHGRTQLRESVPARAAVRCHRP